MVQVIKHNETILAIIVKYSFFRDGIEFLTPGEFSQQLAYMNRGKGHIVEPHVHNIFPRNVSLTQEVLFIKDGKIRIDFYDNEKNYIVSKIIEKGDVVLLASGGHGIEMLEQSEIIEVKQGPYAGEKDKERFSGIKREGIKVE